MFRITSLLLAVIALAPRAQAQTAVSTATIEAGVYDLEITFGGGTLAGVLTVRRADQPITLVVNDHESPVQATRRAGNQMVLESNAPGTDIHYQLEFRGPQVEGSFTYNGEPGKVTGKRRAGS